MKLCPLAKSPCIGPDCMGYYVEYHYGNEAKEPAVYMDTAKELDWNFKGTAIPKCKLFGELTMQPKVDKPVKE